jgi:type I restriction enzyme, S subunit
MKRYETYKPSGIEWLEEIPEHWEEKRVKDLTSKIGSGVTPTGGAEVYSDNGIPFFRSQNIYNNKLSVDDIVYISEEIDKSMSNSRIRPNDILLNITGASIGRCYYVPYNFKRGNVNQHVCIIRPIQNKITTNFLHFELISQYGQVLIEISQNGANREGLNFQQIKNFVFAIPTHTEQTTIANYLDAKTSAIDRKIELLSAKADKYKALRRSLINETVCRGLNPKVPQKDSGIEWIGMIPEHWEVKRVKDVFKYTTGNTPDSKNESYYEGDNTWICIGDISEDKFVLDSKIKISNKAINDLNMVKTPKGSLLYSFKLSIGKMAFVKKDVYTNEAILSIFPNKNISLNFIYYMLSYFLELAATENIYGAKMLNQKLIANAFLVIPKLNEQIQIANYLDSKIVQIDTILTNISEQINKLTQLRKTLINDVVTGKIKVTED